MYRSTINVHPTQSYAKCDSTMPFENRTMGELLQEQVNRIPDRLAIISVHENIQKTYLAFNEDINQLIIELKVEHGLNLSDRVAIWSANCYQYLVIYFACSRLGLNLCLLDPNWKCKELSVALELSTPKVLFLPDVNSKQNVVINDFNKTLKQVRESGFLFNTTVVYISEMTTNQITKSSKSTLIADIQLNTNSKVGFLMVFTSGSTGAPKALVQTEYSILNSSRFIHNRIKVNTSTPTIFCLPLPLNQATAPIDFIPSMVFLGTTFVLPSYKYSLSALVHSIVN